MSVQTGGGGGGGLASAPVLAVRHGEVDDKDDCDEDDQTAAAQPELHLQVSDEDH